MPRNDSLRQERLKRGWSQADVADKIGSDPKTVGRWERGLTSPSPYLCQQLCQLYGKTPQELGLWAMEQPEEQAAPAADTLSAPADAAAPASAAPPARGLKRWPRLRSRPVWFSVLGACTVLVVLGAWVGVRLLPPTSVARSTASNPYTGTGTLTMSDSLASGQGVWPTEENDQGTCSFAAGGYEIRGVVKQLMKPCMAAKTSYRNFVYEVRLQIRAGDCGGLAFRGKVPLLYYFIICQDGHFRFVRYDLTNAALRLVIVAEISSEIHEGYNSQPNTIAVMAQGDAFTLYINHTSVGSYKDDAYAVGPLGLIAHTCRVTYPDGSPNQNLCTAPTEVLFQDVRVWKI